MSTLQQRLEQIDINKEKLQLYPDFSVTQQAQQIRDYYIDNSNAVEGLIDEETNIGHHQAYNQMIDLAVETTLPLSEDLIKTLHLAIYQQAKKDEAGHYRTESIINTDTMYHSPEPDDLAHLMTHFIDQIMSSRHALHPIELAAMAHRRFLDIHPFLSGNGLVARLIMNLILVYFNYPVVTITPTLKNDYIDALSISRRFSDLDPFSQFIAALVDQTQSSLLTIEEGI